MAEFWASDGWASQEDFEQAFRDGWLGGTAFIRRNDQGLLVRVDPTTIRPSEEPAEAGSRTTDKPDG